MPRVGTPMLFAYTGDDGRLAVVRTGTLLRFETLGASPSSSGEIHVEWEQASAPSEGDDDCRTVPLRQSGERPTPRAGLFEAPERDRARPAATRAANVRPQERDAIAPSESAPTLKLLPRPIGRGVLPRKARRG